MRLQTTSTTSACLVAGTAWAAGLLALLFAGGPAAVFAQDHPYPFMPPTIPEHPVQKPKPPAAAQTLNMVPKARKLSTYTLDGRLEIYTKKVSFEAPPAYSESFGVWSERMQGIQKSELIEYFISTEDTAEDGTVIFHRQTPRYQVEIVKDGHPAVPYGSLVKDVTALAWDGTLDAQGNVKAIHRVAGEDTEDMKQLSFPILEGIFPRLDGPRVIKIGEGFTDMVATILPAHLTLYGLEDVGMIMTRQFVLKENLDGRAVFDVKVAFSINPDTPPKAPRTTCSIRGGGNGQAVFDVKRGIFTSTRLPVEMTIDLEAPLRRLPGRPENEDPGLGKSHIALGLILSADQKVQRVWGDDTD